jgi:hypothetical protein
MCPGRATTGQGCPACAKGWDPSPCLPGQPASCCPASSWAASCSPASRNWAATHRVLLRVVAAIVLGARIAGIVLAIGVLEREGQRLHVHSRPGVVGGSRVAATVGRGCKGGGCLRALHGGPRLGRPHHPRSPSPRAGQRGRRAGWQADEPSPEGGDAPSGRAAGGGGGQGCRPAGGRAGAGRTFLTARISAGTASRASACRASPSSSSCLPPAAARGPAAAPPGPPPTPSGDAGAPLPRGLGPGAPAPPPPADCRSLRCACCCCHCCCRTSRRSRPAAAKVACAPPTDDRARRAVRPGVATAEEEPAPAAAAAAATAGAAAAEPSMAAPAPVPRRGGRRPPGGAAPLGRLAGAGGWCPRCTSRRSAARSVSSLQCRHQTTRSGQRGSAARSPVGAVPAARAPSCWRSSAACSASAAAGSAGGTYHPPACKPTPQHFLGPWLHPKPY